jgi:hypothetical protein
MHRMLRRASYFAFNSPSVQRSRRIAVTSMTACFLVIVVRLVYIQPPDLAVRMAAEAWLLCKQSAPFSVSLLGVFTALISAAIKWQREGLKAVKEHLWKYVWETFVPTAAVLFVGYFLFNLLYVVPSRIMRDAREISIRPRLSIPMPPGWALVSSLEPPIPKRTGIEATDSRIQFTVSVLWNENRESVVREQIHRFDAYLSQYGILRPPAAIPLISIFEGTAISNAFITPSNPPFDQRHIPVATERMGPAFIRRSYANFVFHTLLGVYDDLGQMQVLMQESWVYSDYFADSSIGTQLTAYSRAPNDWRTALWEIRTAKGREITDRAMLYGITAPVQYNSDMNTHLRNRLQQGILVVQNNFEDLVTINKILDRNGLLH